MSIYKATHGPKKSAKGKYTPKELPDGVKLSPIRVMVQDKADVKSPEGLAVAEHPELHTASIQKERSIEQLRKMMDLIGSDGDSPPVLIGKVDGELIVQTCEVKDGEWQLPTLKAPSSWEQRRKRRLAEKIVKELTPTLKRDIAGVVYMAMLRKNEGELKEALKELRRKNTKPRLNNRLGCIFVEIEDKTFQV